MIDLKKKVPEQTLKNTDAKYAVTISGGRQRYNATSTLESLSGANLQPQQAAARNSDNLQYYYEYRHCCCCCMIRTGYANTWYLVRRFIRVHTSVRNYKKRLNIIKDTKCSSHFRTNWCMTKKVQAMSVQRACKCEMHARRERVSGILLKHESLPGANEVGGHDRGKHYLLSMYYSSTLQYLALYTAAVI